MSENNAILPGEGQTYQSRKRKKAVHFDNFRPRVMKISGFDNLINRINVFFVKLNSYDPLDKYEKLSQKNIREIREKINIAIENPYFHEKIFIQKNKYKKRSTRKKIYLAIDYYDRKEKKCKMRFMAEYFTECRDFRTLSNEYNCKSNTMRFKKYPTRVEPEIEIEYRENGAAN